MLTSPIQSVQVIANDPSNGGLLVMFKSGQLAQIKCGFDYADGLRIKHIPQPARGTWGLAIFPNSDIRNGHWLMASYSNLQDAISAPQGDPFQDYESHMSGHWYLRDGQGNYAEQWPDGSYFTAGSSTGLPQTYRHIVDENQVPQRIPFTRQDRIPKPPAPFFFNWVLQSGTSILIDNEGNAVVNGASGSTLTLNWNGSQITIDPTGNIGLNLDGGAKVNITLAGGAASDMLVLVSKFIQQFNAHTHGGVTNGGDISSVPTLQLQNTDVASTLIAITE